MKKLLILLLLTGCMPYVNPDSPYTFQCEYVKPKSEEQRCENSELIKYCDPDFYNGHGCYKIYDKRGSYPKELVIRRK